MFFFSHNKTHRGFTLVELVMSLGIITIILTLVLSNQSKYTDGTALTSLADDIGLSLSQAQIYGVSVKEFSPGSNEFNSAYGVEFNLTDSGSNDAYISFADRGSRNFQYDDGWACPIGGSSECLSKTTITRGNMITALCSITANNQESCNIGRIDVIFVRPLTNANFTFFNSAGNKFTVPNARGARIMLESSSGATRSVVVYTTGQISIQ